MLQWTWAIVTLGDEIWLSLSCSSPSTAVGSTRKAADRINHFVYAFSAAAIHNTYVEHNVWMSATTHKHTCIQKKVKVHDRHLTASYMEVKIFEKSNVDIFVLMRNTKWYISHLHLYLHLMWINLQSFVSSEPRKQVREGGREQHFFVWPLFFLIKLLFVVESRRPKLSCLKYGNGHERSPLKLLHLFLSLLVFSEYEALQHRGCHWREQELHRGSINFEGLRQVSGLDVNFGMINLPASIAVVATQTSISACSDGIAFLNKRMTSGDSSHCPPINAASKSWCKMPPLQLWR